jgi:hypothetical protein
VHFVACLSSAVLLIQQLSAFTANVNQPVHLLLVQLDRYTVRATLANVLRQSTGGTGRRQQQQQALPLPTPISPLAAAEADSDPFCAESASLQQYATNSNGWIWGNFVETYFCPHPNCNILGFYGSGIGQTLELTIDTQSSATATNGAVLERLNLVVIFSSGHLPMWSGRIGVAQLACVSGCSCQPVKLARPAPSSTGGKLAAARTEVRVCVCERESVCAW